MDREELAWCAALIDGEGHISARWQESRQHMKLRLGITQNDRRVLDRFQRAVGVGKVYGPYLKAGKKNPSHEYVASDLHAVQAVIAMVWFKLDVIKREQAVRALARYHAWSQPKMAAWTECSNGHPLDDANRGFNSTSGRVWCRLCTKEKMVLSRRRRQLAVGDWT